MIEVTRNALLSCYDKLEKLRENGNNTFEYKDPKEVGSKYKIAGITTVNHFPLGSSILLAGGNTADEG